MDVRGMSVKAVCATELRPGGSHWTAVALKATKQQQVNKQSPQAYLTNDYTFL